jgi:soluble lytic murein transglycosylase
VIRARAYDRAENRDSARTLYVDAAKRLPQISDWLYLRAAGVTGSKSDRQSYYGHVKSDVAKERIGWTEAFALERFGDIEDAIDKYKSVGGMVGYFRLKLAAAKDSEAKKAIGVEMLTWISRAPASDMLRDAIDLFDRNFPNTAPGDDLVLARAAWRAGVSKRTVAAYVKAMKGGLGSDADHFDNGLALFRLKSYQGAIIEFNKVKTPAPLAAAAQYQRARSLIATGNTAQARTVLRTVTTQYASDTSAASALMLLADLATDDQRDDDAKSALTSVVQRFPRSRHAPTALYRSGLITYLSGNMRGAAATFDSVVRLYPDADDASSARYWGGRAYSSVGDTTTARARWRETIDKEPSSYYAVVAAKRLKTPIVSNPSTPDAYPSIPEVDAARTRVAMLRDVGMDVEMKFEWDDMYEKASQSPDRMVATSHALAGTEQASRSILLGIKSLKESGRTPQNYRLVYPLVEHETIIAAAKQNGLDPVLIASLIRQESNYNPRAVSGPGARGLMQLMPDVGRSLGAAEGIKEWNNDLLFDPAVNIRLGTRHLKSLMRSYPMIEKVLAAYNAGESRVVRWSTKKGANDPEMFTERIPFVETRDYVRAIQRNREFYKELYSW